MEKWEKNHLFWKFSKGGTGTKQSGTGTKQSGTGTISVLSTGTSTSTSTQCSISHHCSYFGHNLIIFYPI